MVPPAPSEDTQSGCPELLQEKAKDEDMALLNTILKLLKEIRGKKSNCCKAWCAVEKLFHGKKKYHSMKSHSFSLKRKTAQLTKITKKENQKPKPCPCDDLGQLTFDP